MNPAEAENQLRIWNAFRIQLIAQGLDEDDQCLLDTLEGATNLHEILISIVGTAVEADTMAEAQKLRIAALQERKARYERRADRLRAFVLQIMESAGLKSIEAPEFTFGTRPTPQKVIVTNPESLPTEYLRQKAPEPDLSAIGKALKAGEEIPGAILGNGGTTLQIRTK